VGIKTLPDALTFARELDLDLVEVADKANPPVCRVMDYGKYKYETAQKAKESRRKSTNVVIKEMKYRPKIGGGDFDTKTKKVEHFLDEGHKVKITIMFRGREVAHPELGKKILDRVADEVLHTGKVEVYPKLDGPRNMIMVIAPDKKAQAEAKKQSELEAAEAAGTATASPNGATTDGSEPSAPVTGDAGQADVDLVVEIGAPDGIPASSGAGVPAAEPVAADATPSPDGESADPGT